MIICISCKSTTILITLVLTTLLTISDASSEFNSSQQYEQSAPVARNVDYVPPSSSSHLGTRIVSGGKYRSSYYNPKTKRSKGAMSTAVGLGGQSSASGSGPVYVVLNRQGAPLDDYSSLNPNDLYQYQTVDPNQIDYADNNYYGGGGGGNNYEQLYTNNMIDPYELESLPSSSNDWDTAMRVDSEEEEEDGLGFDLDGLSQAQLKGLMKTRRTGIESLGGLLSLKGLKLSALGSYYLFRGVIILLWKFLPWIFLIGLGLLFIPVPIITIPASAGRNSGSIAGMNMTDVSNNISSLVGRVAESGKCVERISCEIRRQSRDTWFNSALKLLIYNYESQLPSVLQRMAKAYSQRRRCPQYKCNWF